MNKKSVNDLTKAKGIWQIDREIESPLPAEGQLPTVHTFVFDGEHLTIRLMSLSLFQGKPDDDVYSLATKWTGNALSYLPPLSNQWQELASFEEDLFVMYGNGKKRFYKKISPEDVAEWNADLIKKDRQMWDYKKYGVEIN